MNPKPATTGDGRDSTDDAAAGDEGGGRAPSTTAQTGGSTMSSDAEGASLTEATSAQVRAEPSSTATGDGPTPPPESGELTDGPSEMQISERANPIKAATDERAGGPVTTAVDEDDVTTVASSDSSVKANKPTARRPLELSRASEKHDPKATKSAAKSGRKINVETSGDERRADDARESGSKKGKGARKRVPRMTRLNPEVNSMLEEMAAFHGIDINATISVAITMYYRHIFHSRESAPRAGEWPSR